ncbi:tellurite resistance TerB family protein [Microvirga sp. 2MCAF38]|uniref:tellurite resistance TerB family protein n=1 Tax=Microvirga sp. 2MCAF38 TaxID=3232989 RepID=UPI003F97F949
MFDPKVLLDALVGASARPDSQQGQPSRQGGGNLPGPQNGQTSGPLSGGTGGLLQKAKDVLEQNPGLAQAAVIGLAGLLFGARKQEGSAIPGGLAKLGGLAVIGTLAYKAFQGRQQSVGGGTSPSDLGGALDLPKDSSFHPAVQTEDDAMLYLRAMVAAAAADGHVDDQERARIVKGLGQAGVDPRATRWLDQEFASPADVDELASNVNSPEKAAQVYAAARVAIEPDTLQEREFLRRLAESLGLDPGMKQKVDDAASALKV